MHSIIEPAFRCTFGSKWSEDVTFSHQFAVFSTCAFMAERAEKAMTEAGLIDSWMENKRTRELTTTTRTSPIELLFLTTISRSYWHPGRSKRAWHPGRFKMGGRREHVNIDTTTCDPIGSMSKEKIGLKMRVFPKKKLMFVFPHKQKPIGGIGLLAQKDLIQREFCPLTVAKVQKGGFHGCQSHGCEQWLPSIENSCKKREGLSHRWGSLQGFSHKKTFETGSKPPHLEGDLFFIGGIGPRSHPQL